MKRKHFWGLGIVLILLACGQPAATPLPTDRPVDEAVPTDTPVPPTLPPADTPTPEAVGARPAELPLLDDFEAGALSLGEEGHAPVGYFTWSDGSAVSIGTVEVAEGDDLALPGQVGSNTLLRLDTEIKSGGWAGFTHAFANETMDRWIAQDWSPYEGIAMWVYGNGTGGTLFVDIQDNRNPDSSGDDAERWSYDIPDDFEGWQHMEMPFSAFRRKEIGNGAPNDGFTLSEVHGYAVGAYGSVEMGRQSNYVDQVALYGQAPFRPVEIKFAKTAYSAKEGGLATLRLRLNKPADEPVTVQYATVEGNAVLDRDYTLSGDTVVFEPGTMEQSFQINAVDDAIAEGSEQTVVVLYNPTAAVLSPQARAILTIRDDESVDPSVILDFDEAPPFLATGEVTLSILEVAAGSEMALPGQAEYENVLAVTYDATVAPVAFGLRYPEGRDWSDKAGLSFWFYGRDNGDTVAVELFNNPSSTTAEEEPPAWRLIWGDEFDDPAGTPPDPGVWKPEVGDGMMNGIPGWGNGELEYYTDSPENAATDGQGNLVIAAKRLDPVGSNLMCWYGPCEYTSARLITWGRAEFAFGRVEARIKLPFGQGLWSAFWMLGTNLDQAGWPQGGEIDIMENVGREPATVHGTIHGPGYSGGGAVGKGYDLPTGSVSDDFHVYAIEWTPDRIRWFVDEVNFFTATPDSIPAGTEWVYNHPFFLILNLAVGGNWPGDPDETTTFPQEMLVDYVRVYGAVDSSERFEYTFLDDSAGWRHIVVPFSAFVRSTNQPEGAPDDGLDLGEIWGYGLSLPSAGSGSFYLDQIRLETEMP